MLGSKISFFLVYSGGYLKFEIYFQKVRTETASFVDKVNCCMHVWGCRQSLELSLLLLLLLLIIMLRAVSHHLVVTERQYYNNY